MPAAIMRPVVVMLEKSSRLEEDAAILKTLLCDRVIQSAQAITICHDNGITKTRRDGQTITQNKTKQVNDLAHFHTPCKKKK